MAVIEGTSSPKSVTVAYDFAVDGGAIGDINLRAVGSDTNLLPAGSVVYAGWAEVETAVAATGGTFALGVKADADLLAAAESITTGRKDLLVDATGTATLELTAASSIHATVATAAATAGKLTVTLLYV